MGEEGSESNEPAPPPENENKDRVIGEREFKIGQGIDIGGFMVGDAIEEAIESDIRDDKVREAAALKASLPEKIDDDAIGNLINPFESQDSDGESRGTPGEILRDGTVAVAAEIDTVTELAVEGEKRLHWSLMITMIVVYSLIGWLVGTIMPPIVGGIGLLSLAAFGLWLGERWIPNPSMRILGVTWVIISMKLLYGLAIDLHHWGTLADIAPASLGADTLLGILLVLLVGVNVFVAYHHDEDAIAAQATLVTLALASGAGATYGETGLAIMIAIATILLHSLALLRKSGNLASLGIATSNLWIGFHALSNNWEILGLEILNFDDALLLFLLMTFVNAVNATIAARFYKSENWFSQALSVLGLGRPGLWGVSVGLGMIGALMSIAANRAETGYALAQVLLLLAAFGGSYLSVRGVPFSRLQTHLIFPFPILLLILVGLEVGIVSVGTTAISSYGVFTIGATIVTGFTLLKHQTSVSDHVLWLGGLVIIILLTLLVPAEDEQGGRFLLLGVGTVCAGLAFLSILRNSPSIAGVAVLAPWIWALSFATDLETRLINADIILIEFAEWDLAFFLAGMALLQQPVNLRLGSTGVNLASKLLGMSEISSRIRDSGVFRLWNIGLLLSLFGIIAITRPEAITSEGLLLVFFIILGVHIGAEIMGRHQNNPHFLLITLGLAALILQWRIGLDAIWPIFITLASIPLASAELDRLREWLAGADAVDRSADDVGPRPQPERLLTLQMGLVAASAVIFYISKTAVGNSELLSQYWWPSPTLTAWIFVAVTAAIMSTYLPKASTFEHLLQPAVACIALLISIIVAVNDSNYTAWPFWAAVLLFVTAGAWLAAQGEIRSGLISVRRREERVQDYIASKQTAANVGSLDATSEGIKLFDPKLIELAEKQKQRRKRSGSIGEFDLVAGDIHHRPVIVLTFITGLLLGTTWWAFFVGQGESVLAIGGVLSLLFIGLSRWRAETLNLRLPDVVGIEAPIAWTMLGISLTYLGGRLSLTYVSTDEQLSLLILALAILILAGFSLLNRPDLPIRIPSSIEWLLVILAGTRIITYLLGGRMPSLFSVDPFDGELVSWIIPWTVQEAILIMAVFGWDWIESQRIQRELPDHRSAGSRALIVMLIAIISIGPALLLAIILGLRRGMNWDQPAVGMICLPLILVAWASLTSWSDLPLEGTIGIISILVALSAIFLVIHSVANVKPKWTTGWMWDVQILTPIAAVLAFTSYTIPLIVSLLGVSLLAWVCGILQNRRGWRIIGAVNLVSGWLVGIFSLQSTSFDPISALVMLAATGILLGVVTWLGQTYEDELANT